MVFSSLPIYLDPPNWQQHLSQQQTNGNHENPQLIQPQQANGNHENPQLIRPQQEQPHQQPHNHMAPNFTSSGSGGGGTGGHVGGSNSSTNMITTLFKHNSLAEQGRLVKNIAAQPEGVALKCPRCESINTKFCYFNNYNLSQPRHFCKTCRRYWTRGGALRNVPVGGGCRRNKRSKSNQSKSNPSSGTGINSNSNNTSRFTSTPMTKSEGIILPSMGTGSGLLSSGHLSAASHLSLMASLQNMTRLGMGNLGHSSPAGVLQPQGHHQPATKMTTASSTHNLDHQFGTSGCSSPLYLSMQLQQTNHQFPSMAAAAGYHHEVPTAAAVLYPFQNDEGSDASIYGSSGGRNHDQNDHQLNMVRCGYKGTTSSGGVLTQNALVKMENYSCQKKLLGVSAGSTSQFSWNSSGSGDNDVGSY